MALGRIRALNLISCGRATNTLHFTWIVYREGFDQSAVRLRALVEQETLGFDPVREHEIGQILSYTPAQVDIFLQYAQKS